MIRNDEPSLKEFFPVCLKRIILHIACHELKFVPMYSRQEFVKINVEKLFLEG